jgi:carboxymethylenebutenolidase
MSQRTVEIPTEDGPCPAALSIPEREGPWPAVILLPDAGGMRDAMRQMGDRLCGLGFVTLVPDFYYRNGPYEPIDMRAVFERPEAREKMFAMMTGYTPEMVARDATAWVDYLDALPEKKSGGIGTTGYCMGGRLSLLVAAALGARVAAAASFHGGGLAVADNPDSPHRKAAQMKATVYVAGAIEDQSFTDEQKDLLDAALTEAGVRHTIETYPAHHGFAVSDNATFDQAAAERHWQAMEHLFSSALGA